MKKLFATLAVLALPALMTAQGWPANYGGVMMQGFHWNSFVDSRWNNYTQQAQELGQYFDLIWLPQSGKCGGSSMGYDPLYFFNQNSTFGTEAELRAMIAALSAQGVGVITDVVINHHSALTGWLTFPSETYNGVTYQLKSTDICHNDDGGATLTWATTNGYTLSTNDDTGEDWSGARDLDHNSSNVKKIVNAYLKFLLDDIGYVGFRYDMVRGFSGSFLGAYNATAKPTYSVGEHWTNSRDIIEWMKSTTWDGAIQSGAFDFDFRYVVRDAFNNGTAWSLGENRGNYVNWPMVSNGNADYLEGGKYRRYAVTFVENHDVEDRGNVENYHADPLRRDTVAANAFMMAMPGTPCVFLPHWKACKQDIKGLIDVRKAVGITNTSNYTELARNNDYYAIETQGAGSKKLVTVVGNKTSGYVPSASEYVRIVDGYHYRYYMNKACNTPWIDKASGYYDRAQNVTLTAVSTNANAKLVYTTDGTQPTATNGTHCASGTVLRLRESMTLKVGLLIGSSVIKVITRDYELPELSEFEPHNATVYFKDPSKTVSTWTKAYYWAYDGNGSLNTATSWPGDQMTDTVMIGGTKFYYVTYPINDEDYTFNIVFTSATGTPQTVDITGINKDVYYQLNVLNGQGKYTVTDVTKFYESSNPLNQTKDGDIDGDGKVDITDVNAAINIMLGKAAASSFKGKADVTGDGKVDIGDVNAVINIMLGKN